MNLQTRVEDLCIGVLVALVFVVANVIAMGDDPHPRKAPTPIAAMNLTDSGACAACIVGDNEDVWVDGEELVDNAD